MWRSSFSGGGGGGDVKGASVAAGGVASPERRGLVLRGAWLRPETCGVRGVSAPKRGVGEVWPGIRVGGGLLSSAKDLCV